MVRGSSEHVGTGSTGKVEVNGVYHFIVNSGVEHTAKSGNVGIRLEVEVLAGTIEGQVGKKMKNQDFWPQGQTFYDLAAALGLTNHANGQIFTPAQLEQDRADKKAGKAEVEYDFDPAECEGRQFFANVVPELDENKKPKADGWPRIGMNIFSIADPRVAKMPANHKNQVMIDEVLGASDATEPAAEVDPLLT